MARKFKTVEEMETYIETLKNDLDANKTEIETLKKQLDKRRKETSELDDWFWGDSENE